jgi:L-asparaginase
MSPDLVADCVARGARGLVVAGLGNGNVTREAALALAEAVLQGVVVVRSTRLVSGDVGRNVEIDDDALGFVAADQLNPQKSRVLLKLCLTRNLGAAQVQEAFDRY